MKNSVKFSKCVRQKTSSEFVSRGLAEIDLVFPLSNSDDVDQKYANELNKCLKRLFKLWVKQQHSGLSANIIVNFLKPLFLGKPLTPLTGHSSEWNIVCYNYFQNNRLASVFFNPENGEVYDIDGIVLTQDEKTYFSSGRVRKKVTFPYTQNVEYWLVDDDYNLVKKL